MSKSTPKVAGCKVTSKPQSNLRPLHQNLIIKQLTREQLGKVILPDSVQDTWLRGKVIKVGSKVEEDIKVGDIIIFSPDRYGETLDIGDKGYIIINEGMILAIEE